MEKLTGLQGFWLLYFFNGGQLNDPFIGVQDTADLQAIDSLSQLGYIDNLIIDKSPLTVEGIDRAHRMLKAGMNYDSAMKEMSISAKKALFLSLINSGYEPRGLFNILIQKLSDEGFAQLKKAFFKRLNFKSNGSKYSSGKKTFTNRSGGRNS